MFTLSERAKRIREEVTSLRTEKKAVRGQHLYHFIKGYYSVPASKRNNRRLLTASLKQLLENFSPVIFENELIVGYNYDDEG